MIGGDDARAIGGKVLAALDMARGQHVEQHVRRKAQEAGGRHMQGAVKEVVAERFLPEAPCLKPLPLHRYYTSYLELRRVGWDRYVNVRGNRYSVPGELAGQTVAGGELAA